MESVRTEPDRVAALKIDRSKATKNADKPPIFISSETIEQRWIDRSRSNPADFIVYLTDGQLKPAKHHIKWIKAILSDPSARVNIIAFRGAGKTTILNFLLAWLIGKKPWLTHFIGSVALDQAKARLEHIKEILDSPRYKNVFPHVQIDYKKPYDQKQFTVWSSRWDGRTSNTMTYGEYRALVGRFGQPRDATVFASGMTGQGIVGKRFTGLVLIDDPHGEKNSGTSEQRRKVVDIFKRSIMPCMFGDEARASLISTRWAEDDMSGTLAEENRLSGEKIWTTIEIPIMDEEGNSNWPEQFPLEKIQSIREEEGELMFLLMRMNQTKNLETSEFIKDHFGQGLPDPFPYDDITELLISTDFADTENLTSDFTVFMAVARTGGPRFKYFILDMMRFKQTLISKKAESLAEFADNIYQVWGSAMNKVPTILFEHRDSQPELQQIAADRPDLICKVVKTKGDKGERLHLAAPKAQSKLIYVNMGMRYLPALISEVVGFPGKHDDCADAFSLPFQLDSWKPQLTKKAGIVYAKSPFLI